MTLNLHHVLKKQQGFNLVESMVTLFILTVGILGIAALQAYSAVLQRESRHTSEALVLAQSLAEKMRANLTGLNFYDQSNGAHVGRYVDHCFSTAGCSSEEMAYNDIYEWQESAAAQLPDGTGVVCRDSTIPSRVALANGALLEKALSNCDGIGNVFVIHIGWDRDNDGEILLNFNSVNGESVEAPNSDGYINLVFEP